MNSMIIENWIKNSFDDDDVVTYKLITNDELDPDPDHVWIGDLDFPQARPGDYWVFDEGTGCIVRIKDGEAAEVYA